MSKKGFLLLDDKSFSEALTNDDTDLVNVNWDLCFICQNSHKTCKEPLICPANNNSETIRNASYKYIAEQLENFKSIESLPDSLVLRLDMINNAGNILLHELIKNKAKFHKNCKNKYDKHKFDRLHKNKQTFEEVHHLEQSQPSTRTKFNVKNFKMTCIFCEKEDNKKNLSLVMTQELSKKLQTLAIQLSEEKLLARLSEGDAIAIEVRYHKACLVSLYNHCRALKKQTSNKKSSCSIIKGLVLAEICDNIKKAYKNTDIVPVFKLSDLNHIYCDRLKEYGTPISYSHSSRLKEKILSQIPQLVEFKQGREVLLTFESMGSAIQYACNQSFQDDGVCLALAAKIIRNQLINHQNDDSNEIGIYPGCEEKSVPLSVVTFINMILGQNVSTENSQTVKNNPALTITQLLRFHLSRRKKLSITSNTRHSKLQKCPVALYIGLELHSKTGKKSIISTMADLGLSVSYDRVKNVQLAVAKQLCKKYQDENLVFPINLKEGLFTTSAIDNLDYNPTSTTATDSFHGTSISIFQHPNCEYFEEADSLIRDLTPEDSDVKLELPEYYTLLKPTISKNSEYPLQNVNMSDIDYIDPIKNLSTWLLHLNFELQSQNIRMSWPGFHSKLMFSNKCSHFKSISALLPLLKESINSTTMVRHSIDIIKRVLYKTNPDQVPVVTADQPVYALGKQLQWSYPESYGEDKLLMMMGALHIEMAFLNTIGDWLEGSGWIEIIIKSGISTPGRAESFLTGSNVKRSRQAHQVTSAVLHLLLKDAFNSSEEEKYEEWLKFKLSTSVQFKYWFTVLQLESILLLLIESLRKSDFHMFVSALEQIAPWFFALDHTHYSRWLPVFINDLKMLKDKHHYIYSQFLKGGFTIKKTNKMFSAISEDQAHEQNNKLVKIDTGAIGLFDNHISMMKWMVAGPEISRILHCFAENNKNATNVSHHEDSDAYENLFCRNVEKFKAVFDECGNPFMPNNFLINVVSKQIMNDKAAESVKDAYDLGKSKYLEYVDIRLLRCEVSIYAPISKNKLPLFRAKNFVTVSKERLKTVSLKQDCKLFASLYVACQSRKGSLEDFFKHENHAYPPAISEYGMLHKGTKSDFLKILEAYSENEFCDPILCTAKIIDGAVLVQMTQPVNCKTFGDYAVLFCEILKKDFSRNISLKRIDIVFDRYFKGSLKSETRARRGSGIRISVKKDTPMCTNWHLFLQVDNNKEELFSLLANEMQVMCLVGRVVIATCGESIVSNDIKYVSPNLLPCNHEEADTRLLLHCNNASLNGHTDIIITTVDTDVVVIAVAMFSQLNLKYLWIEFGTGKHKRMLPIHDYVKNLGPLICSGLLFWYAFTGCDTVSSFSGHGKKKAWNTWKSYPEVSGIFARLSLYDPVLVITDNDLKYLERYVVLLYDSSSNVEEVDLCRHELFTKKGRSINCLPPTKDALVQHSKRALLQSGLIWGQSLKTWQDKPNFGQYGWNVVDEAVPTPIWSTIPEASKACYELIKCGCKTNCSTARCKCHKSNLKCTELCSCSGNCS